MYTDCFDQFLSLVFDLKKTYKHDRKEFREINPWEISIPMIYSIEIMSSLRNTSLLCLHIVIGNGQGYLRKFV